MINFEITASPAIGKKIEFEQSLTSIQKKINEISPSFQVQIINNEKYQFSFVLKTEDDLNRLFTSNGFLLFSGAIKTLCEKKTLTLNNPTRKINLFNCKNLLDIKEYFNLKKGVKYAN